MDIIMQNNHLYAKHYLQQILLQRPDSISF